MDERWAAGIRTQVQGAVLRSFLAWLDKHDYVLAYQGIGPDGLSSLYDADPETVIAAYLEHAAIVPAVSGR